MAYGELIRLGDGFDGDNTLNTSFVKSDAIESNGYLTEIQIEVTGGSGDSDVVQVYQFNTLANILGNFDTDGKSIGTITLNGATTIRKSFTLKPSRRCKVGLRMASGSTETPTYKGVYVINSSVNYRTVEV